MFMVVTLPIVKATTCHISRDKKRWQLLPEERKVLSASKCPVSILGVMFQTLWPNQIYHVVLGKSPYRPQKAVFILSESDYISVYLITGRSFLHQNVLV